MAKEPKLAHLVWSWSQVGGMSVAIDKARSANQLILIPEVDGLFSVGPLNGLDTDEGRRKRRLWFKERYSEQYNAAQKTDFRSNLPNHATVLAPDCLPEEVQIVVWHGDNAHEQAGLRYALNRLRQSANEIRLLNTYRVHASLFDRPDWKVAFSHSGEISPDKLMPMLAKALESPAISAAERERLAGEWSQWADSSDTLRIWQDGHIQGVPDSHFDEMLLRTVQELQWAEGGWVRAARTAGAMLGQDESFAGDGFFEYRLRELIRSGALEAEGSLADMGGYRVRVRPNPNEAKGQ